MEHKWYVKNSRTKGKGKMNMEEMVKDPNCAYCVQRELVAKLGHLVCEMSTGILYVLEEQSKEGRVILTHEKRANELIDLTNQEWNGYFAEITQVSRAIHKVPSPDKVNYGAYDGMGYHLHFHIVPRYQGGEEWGDTSGMNSRRTILPDGECEEVTEALRKALKEV